MCLHYDDTGLTTGVPAEREYLPMPVDEEMKYGSDVPLDIPWNHDEE